MPQKIFTIENENLIKKQDFQVDFEHSNPILPTTKNIHLNLKNSQTKCSTFSRYKHFIIGFGIIFFLLLGNFCYKSYYENLTSRRLLTRYKFYLLEAEWGIYQVALKTINEIAANGGPLLKINKNLKVEIKNMNANLNEEYFFQKPHQNFMNKFFRFAAFIINGILYWMVFKELTHHKKWLLSKLYDGEEIPEIKSKNLFYATYLLYLKYPAEIRKRKPNLYEKYCTRVIFALSLTVISLTVFAEDTPFDSGFFRACQQNLQNSNFKPSKGLFGFDIYESSKIQKVIHGYQTEIKITQEIISENPICDSKKILSEKLNYAKTNLNKFETCKKLKLLKNQIIVAIDLILFSTFFAVIFTLRRHLNLMDKFCLFVFVMGEIIFLNVIRFY